jgi:predicted transcriptional regulator
VKAEPAIFDQADLDAESAADARARADMVAGRIVDHAEVVAWLAKWGTDEERPAPPEWLA